MEETSIWVGIDGVYNQDLLQAGITESGFTVSTSHTHTSWPTPDVAPILCGGGMQVYAWWEDLPSGPERVNLPVHVGDSFTVSIFKMSPGWWTVALHDLTDLRSSFLAVPYKGPRTSVEWVVEAPQVLGLLKDPVPFSTLNFHDLDADGTPLRLERFVFGSGRCIAFPSGSAATTGQLMRTGFAVNWAPVTRQIHTVDQCPPADKHRL